MGSQRAEHYQVVGRQGQFSPWAGIVMEREGHLGQEDGQWAIEPGLCGAVPIPKNWPKKMQRSGKRIYRVSAAVTHLSTTLEYIVASKCQKVPAI